MIKQYFNNRADRWEQTISNEDRNRLSVIFDTKIPDLHGPLLDLGCGTGILVPHVIEKMEPASLLVEMDIAGSMLKINRKNSSFRQGVHYVCGASYFLPFGPESFSTVICYRAYPHFSEKYMAEADIFRILKRNGNFIILHLMGHRELNDMHRSKKGIVENHMMIPVGELSSALSLLGFNDICSVENKSLYLYIGKKKETHNE